MEIIKCYVSSFGKLKNRSFDFSEGLNEINQKNGWGKTTLCSFITAIFYGLDSGRKSILDSDRKKYKPWNSMEKFGGYIEFSWKEYRYRLERYFGNKESEDEVVMTDLKTGKIVSKTENLGERIFGIDKEGFTSSTYFSQKSLEVKINSGITAKLNSVLDFGDAVAFDKAVACLEKKAKYYKMQGSKGLLAELQNKIYSANEDILRAKKADETLTVVKADVEELNKKIKEINDKIKNYTAEFENASKAEAIKIKKDRYEELKAETDKISVQINGLIKSLNGYDVKEEEINYYKKLYKDFIALNEKISVLKQTVTELKAAATKTPKTNKETKIYTYLFAAFVAIALVGVVGFFASFGAVVSAVLLGIGVVGAFTFVGLNLKSGNKKPDFSLLEMLEKNQKELSLAENTLNDYADKLTAFSEKFKIDYNDYNSFLTELSGINDKIALLKTEQEEKTKTLSLYQNEIVGNNNFSVAVSLEDSKMLLEQARRDYQTVNERLSEKKVALLRLSETAQNLVDCENKKTELTEKLAEATSEYQIVVKTLEILKKADENLKAKFREPLENSFNKYIKEIDESFNAVSELDLDMTVKIREDTGSFETAYFSEGFKALFEICKRFSLIDVLFDKEKPFIILDDPFVNLDKDKISGAINALNTLSKEYQIIYFTCHESRSANGR